MWNYRWPDRHVPPSEGFVTSPPALSLARYYGWPLVSEHDAIYHEFVDSMRAGRAGGGGGGRVGSAAAHVRGRGERRQHGGRGRRLGRGGSEAHGRRHARRRPELWDTLKPDLVHPTSEAEGYYADLIMYALWLGHQAWRCRAPSNPARPHERGWRP